MTRYRDLLDGLRRAYDGGAERRDAASKDPWKLTEREAFLARLRDAGAVRLLEVGAGTGQDAAFFLDNGLEVVATDLSQEMVARCRAKGLEAHVMDFLGLDFPDASFDAVHAMNCLLHVPNADLPDVLAGIARVLVPGGLFFMGVYGGEPSEGPHEGDWHVPPRFFSWRTDDQIQAFAREQFEIVDFHPVTGDGFRTAEGEDFHFQSLTLRRP